MDTHHISDTTHCRLIDRRRSASASRRLSVVKEHAHTAESSWQSALRAYEQFADLPPGEGQEQAREALRLAIARFHVHLRAAEAVCPADPPRDTVPARPACRRERRTTAIRHAIR